MREYSKFDRLYRDTARAKVSGVCAGLAKHWQQPRWIIRLATIICFLFLPLATAIAYGMAVLLLPTRS